MVTTENLTKTETILNRIAWLSKQDADDEDRTSTILGDVLRVNGNYREPIALIGHDVALTRGEGERSISSTH